MPKQRGKEHTTLTETAALVVRELKKLQKSGINPDPYFYDASGVDANRSIKNLAKKSNTQPPGDTQQNQRHKSEGGIKMIAPGEIKTNSRKGPGKRFITAVYTTAGLELIISGQSVQKVSVHTEHPKLLVQQLKNAKSLRDFAFKSRDRKPGQ